MAKWHDSADWRKARAYAKRVLQPVCTSCNKDLTGDDWTIDHIIAPGLGEPNHDIHNLQSMCRSCNSKKQDRVLKRITWLNARFKAPSTHK